eukprot:INCI1337.1.p2 GENE.INCI1337.1~~INCI1337.1.p2  ORF type:complete len:381 (+),score=70.01 INCI1337.1:662-1804(+)
MVNVTSPKATTGAAGETVKNNGATVDSVAGSKVSTAGATAGAAAASDPVVTPAPAAVLASFPRVLALNTLGSPSQVPPPSASGVAGVPVGMMPQNATFGAADTVNGCDDDGDMWLKDPWGEAEAAKKKLESERRLKAMGAGLQRKPKRGGLLATAIEAANEESLMPAAASKAKKYARKSKSAGVASKTRAKRKSPAKPMSSKSQTRSNQQQDKRMRPNAPVRAQQKKQKQKQKQQQQRQPQPQPQPPLPMYVQFVQPPMGSGAQLLAPQPILHGRSSLGDGTGKAAPTSAPTHAAPTAMVNAKLHPSMISPMAMTMPRFGAPHAAHQVYQYTPQYYPQAAAMQRHMPWGMNCGAFSSAPATRAPVGLLALAAAAAGQRHR